MNYRRGIDTYRQTDMQTMGKEKIIVLLYEKMLEHFDAAAAASSLDRMEMSRRLGLAQRIVTELQGALDHSIGGDIAANLDALYNYLFREILAMQLDRDPDHASQCRRVIEPLLSAWSSIPPGTGDRELRNGHGAGTETANSMPETPAAPLIPGERLISISA